MELAKQMTRYHATVNGQIPFTKEEETARNTEEANVLVELAADHLISVKIKRNNLLEESDWTQMPDSPLTDAEKTTWQTYRQALRDITSHANFPNLQDADWPTKP